MTTTQQASQQTLEARAAGDAQIKAALAALEREPVPAALVIDAMRADWVGNIAARRSA